MNEASGQAQGVPPTSPPQPASPQEKKYLALVRQLTDCAAAQVIKVATCKCDKKDTCKVYLQGQRMADIIDQLQEIQVSGVVAPARTGPEGRAKGGKRRGRDSA